MKHELSIYAKIFFACVIATLLITLTHPITAVHAQGSDDFAFISDISVPDNSNVTANMAFTKTWKVANTGSNPWTGAYTLRYVRGDMMGAPTSTALSAVNSGDSVELSLTMTAPAAAGHYEGVYDLFTPAGVQFGKSELVVIINVTTSDNEAVASVTPVLNTGESTVAQQASGGHYEPVLAVTQQKCVDYGFLWLWCNKYETVVITPATTVWVPATVLIAAATAAAPEQLDWEKLMADDTALKTKFRGTYPSEIQHLSDGDWKLIAGLLHEDETWVNESVNGVVRFKRVFSQRNGVNIEYWRDYVQKVKTMVQASGGDPSLVVLDEANGIMYTPDLGYPAEYYISQSTLDRTALRTLGGEMADYYTNLCFQYDICFESFHEPGIRQISINPVTGKVSGMVDMEGTISRSAGAALPQLESREAYRAWISKRLAVDNAALIGPEDLMVKSVIIDAPSEAIVANALTELDAPVLKTATARTIMTKLSVGQKVLIGLDVAGWVVLTYELGNELFRFGPNIEVPVVEVHHAPEIENQIMVDYILGESGVAQLPAWWLTMASNPGNAPSLYTIWDEANRQIKLGEYPQGYLFLERYSETNPKTESQVILHWMAEGTLNNPISITLFLDTARFARYEYIGGAWKLTSGGTDKLMISLDTTAFPGISCAETVSVDSLFRILFSPICYKQ